MGRDRAGGKGSGGGDDMRCEADAGTDTDADADGWYDEVDSSSIRTDTDDGLSSIGELESDIIAG